MVINQLMRPVFVLSAIAAASLLPAHSTAQETFSDMIAVTEVEVPVRVLLKGKPLAGLTAENFEIYDRGELQTMTGFSVRNLRPNHAGAPLAGARAGASPAPTTTAGDPAARRLFILFDFAFSRRDRLSRAMDAIRVMVDEQLDPDDRVGVGTYGAISGLNLLVGFTTDRPKIHTALNAVDAMLNAKRGLQRDELERLHRARFTTANTSTYEVLAEELSPAAALALLSGPVEYSEAEDDGVTVEEQASFFGPIQVRVEVDVTEPIDISQDLVDVFDESHIRAYGLSLAELATLLRDVGGQKDMVLYSQGVSGPLLTNARSLFYLQKTFKAFRNSNWTMHVIDVGGVPGLDDPTFASNSLLLMSKETGGDLIENMNNLSKANDRVLQRTSIVYVLSFQPENDERRKDKDDKKGDFREIEIKLRDAPKGAKIVHRPGYYGPRPIAKRDKFEQRVDAAQWLLSNLEADELDVEITTREPSAVPGGVRIPLTADVSGTRLLEIETKKPTTLEFHASVLDAQQRVHETLLGSYHLDFQRSSHTLEAGGVRFVAALELEPGKYELRILVRSRRNGEVFLASRPLQVPEGPPGKEGVEPLVGSDDPNWLTTEAERRSSYFQ